MNVGGVLLLAFIGSLAQSAVAQAVYTVSYTQLFSLITWTSVGIMGAAAAVAGQNLGAGNPDRASNAVRVASRIGLVMAACIGLLFFFIPRILLAAFGMNEPEVVEMGVQLLRVLSLSGLFITVALSYTGGVAGDGRYQKSAVYLDRLADHHPSGHVFRAPANGNTGCHRHLARYFIRPHGSKSAERNSLQSREMALDKGRYWRGLIWILMGGPVPDTSSAKEYENTRNTIGRIARGDPGGRMERGVTKRGLCAHAGCRIDGRRSCGVGQRLHERRTREKRAFRIAPAL